MPRRSPSALLRATCAAACAALLVGPTAACYSYRSVSGSPVAPAAPGVPRQLGRVRAVLSGGGTLSFRDARVEGDSLVGQLGTARASVEQARTAVALADVRLVEAQRLDAGKTGRNLATGFLVYVSLVSVIAAIAWRT